MVSGLQNPKVSLVEQVKVFFEAVFVMILGIGIPGSQGQDAKVRSF